MSEIMRGERLMTLRVYVLEPDGRVVEERSRRVVRLVPDLLSGLLPDQSPFRWPPCRCPRCARKAIPNHPKS